MIKPNGREMPNTKEFAERSGIPERTLYRYLETIPRIKNATKKVGKHRYWDEDKFWLCFESGLSKADPVIIPEEEHRGPKRELRIAK